jgi:membrane protease YdiL (CAAX protease family)
MLVLVFLASNIIGTIPILVTSSIKSLSDPQVMSRLSADPNDFGALGINENLLLGFMLIPFIIGLIAFAFMMKPLHYRSFMTTINAIGKIRWKHFFSGALVWIIFMFAYLIIYKQIDPENFTINNKSSSLILLVLISFLLIPFQAAFEEVIFRGYLMQGFSHVIRNRFFPLLSTSVMFALLHSLNPEVMDFGFLTMMPQYLVFGLIFGLVTILDDGIEAAMGAHAANNIFLCIMVTHRSSALQTPALFEQHDIYPWAELAGLVASGILFVLILRRIFKWDDFTVIFRRVNKSEIKSQIP